MKPPFAYFGGKTRIAEGIVDLLPDHEGYIEPFGGSLSVLLAKPVDRFEVVNDLSQDLMTFWRVLRDQPAEFERVCALTPHSRAEVIEAHSRDTVDDLERARRVWVLLTQGRAGTFRQTGWRFYEDSSNCSFTTYLDGYKARLAPVAARLINVSLECRPALEVIERYGRHSGNLLYVDPPYLNRTRNSRGYEHEMGTEREHEDLLQALLRVDASVVISGYDDPLYGDLLAGWRREVLLARTQSGRHREEVLWINRSACRQQVFDFGAIA